jgi:hypothetical protein
MLSLSRSRLQCQHSLNLVVMISIFAFAVCILSYSFGIFASPTLGIEYTPTSSSTTKPLDVFQVQAPLRATYEGASCQQVILQHNFAASYGAPYVGKIFKLYFNNELMKSRILLSTRGLRFHNHHFQPLGHLNWYQL